MATEGPVIRELFGRKTLRPCLVVLALLPELLLAGCRDGGRSLPSDGGFPQDLILYTESTLQDADLAAQAYAVIAAAGDGERRCQECHGLTVSQIRRWGDHTNAALDCIGARDPALPAQAAEIWNCLTDGASSDEADGATSLDPEAMGFLTTAAPLLWFRQLFEVAYAGESALRIAQRRGSVTMPPPAVDSDGEPLPDRDLTQSELDLLLSWVRRGLPLLEEQVPGGGKDCAPYVGPEVAGHLIDMETQGWDVLNRDRSLAMFGCAEGQSGQACLSDYPLTGSGPTNGWTELGVLRILFTTDYASSFWTRSSADGRYVAHGGGSASSASIIDLERQTVIPSLGLYDSGFFPDNSGFVLMAVGPGTQAGFCEQSLLDSGPSEITYEEPECSLESGIGLYQHLGAVDGGDYWTVYGPFVSDDGGHRATGPLRADFSSASSVNFVPIIYDGSSYSPRAAVSVATPSEGDAVLSPSGQLVASRIEGVDGAQSGFSLRRVDAEPEGDSYAISAPLIAEYCIRGSKVGFSFDERYLVLHRYLDASDAVEFGFDGADDPEFAAYLERGAANIYVVDLLTGDQRRITRMNPGQYALFPHFRSDGWIYFIVRDPYDDALSGEYVVASDAVLRLQ
ncbi:MAG: hypothetical protein AAF355_01445 [Myxococcota bacterium]